MAKVTTVQIIQKRGVVVARSSLGTRIGLVTNTIIQRFIVVHAEKGVVSTLLSGPTGLERPVPTMRRDGAMVAEPGLGLSTCLVTSIIFPNTIAVSVEKLRTTVHLLLESQMLP